MTDDLPGLHVGDHVQDQDNDDDQSLLVTGLPLERAASCVIDDDGTTIADVNPDYPREDHVIEIAYLDRTDVFVDEQPSYGFPRSRLELETPLHDRDTDEEETDE